LRAATTSHGIGGPSPSLGGEAGGRSPGFILIRSARSSRDWRHAVHTRNGPSAAARSHSRYADSQGERDLGRIHSHLCSVAYPVLEAAGDLSARIAPESEPADNTITYKPNLP
jgi:hypothetical protein